MRKKNVVTWLCTMQVVYDEIIYISTLQTTLVCVGVFSREIAYFFAAFKGSGHRRRAEGFLPLRFRVDPVGVPLVCALPHSYLGRRARAETSAEGQGKMGGAVTRT